MHSGRERLAAWLKRSNLNQREGAKLLRLHWTFLNQILLGRRSPGLANAVLIERVTGVPVEAWLSTRVSKRDQAIDDTDRNGK